MRAEKVGVGELGRARAPDHVQALAEARRLYGDLVDRVESQIRAKDKDPSGEDEE